MGLFDRFRKKKIEKVESEQLEPVYEDVKKGMNKEDAIAILNEEVKGLFPETGIWYILVSKGQAKFQKCICLAI